MLDTASDIEQVAFRRRLDAMRRSCDAEGYSPEGLTFRRRPLETLSRDDLETIVAFQMLKHSGIFGDDLILEPEAKEAC